MKIIGIIPARYASTRFPGKPLVNIGGKSMIQRVYEQVKSCKSLTEVVVATDDTRIQQHVEAFGGKVVMTSSDHPSGTDRCAEVIQSYNDYDVVINIQGDEPFINPEQIDMLAILFQESDTEIGTLVKRIETTAELFNENSPKVVFNSKRQALYFSRQTIPFQRGVARENWLDHQAYYKHIGIYGYRRHILQEITNLNASAFEKSESLEQLRWLENGYIIKVAESMFETVAVDTPEDLEQIQRIYFKH
ncbi:3-deoxy-manno-octulosonate cytidylyltransferase [Sphingobacterium psychroaquaticum]|uniref:3-deoxy-manno-octulosonate cytidylyltransferase n=1 Tax=Sphingobacterium psychroaquaticum TaxID=561061 RepID=A0A1X7JR13_9SPHI|nr:3-deoxy-manno-octulosonate cytidylyltransferase [Sphingobacterium psychroaquaticum]SMG29947.1 3-deoxy-manno-octulosonate cytidylyltransferase (CMP-KDO synthetase) [Sphingobacterium psychroaquaticum]